MKPVSFDRFLKAIDKAANRHKQNIPPESAAPLPTQAVKSEQEILFVKSEGKLVKIDLNHILFLESVKDYVRFWTTEGNVVVHTTMKQLEEQLKKYSHFVRVQKSYIVNINHITEVWGNSIRIGDQSITIGSTYRDEVNRILESYKLS